MIPLHDDNPTRITPYVTIAVIGACALVFLWELSLSPGREEIAFYAYGVVPAVLFGDLTLPPEVHALPPALTVVSSMFLHGGWMHLIGNMMYLWIFGNNIEDAMGHGRFVLFYLLCGAAAALAQGLAAPGSVIPMIGASGAISGVLGAYLLLHPRARVLTLLTLGFFFYFVRIRAAWVLGFWIVLQVFNAAIAPADAGGVAWLAHVGGFAAGVLLIGPFKYRHVPFFGSARPPPPPRPPRRGPRRGPWG